jgi:hypothetical protein
MIARLWHASVLGLGGAVLTLGLTGSTLADDMTQAPKGKGGKPTIVQIDLNQLPPNLAKQLLELSKAGEKKGPAYGKQMAPERIGPPAAGKGKTGVQLPPGLANKPKDHPGRVTFLRSRGQTEAPKPAPKYEGKDQKEKKKPGPRYQGRGTLELPPGLARKAPDHPGRVAFLKAADKKEPAKKPGKKQGDDD